MSVDASEAHPTHELSFAVTLSARERRLASRLESFGDIVFGFAVSQCAVQLPTTNGHVDLVHPLALVLYFVTFSILVSLWLIYHRMMSGTYKPSGIDLALPFVYLALVSLIPYAMYAITHGLDSLTVARDSLASYLTLYATMSAVAAVVMLRNLRRGYFFTNADDRDREWATFLRQLVLVTIMTAALVADRLVGPTTAGFVTILIAPVMRLCRVLFRHAPSAATLRIRPTRHDDAGAKPLPVVASS